VERDAETVREICDESVLVAVDDSKPLDTMLGDASLVELLDCLELGETEVELVTLLLTVTEGDADTVREGLGDTDELAEKDGLTDVVWLVRGDHVDEMVGDTVVDAKALFDAEGDTELEKDTTDLEAVLDWDGDTVCWLDIDGLLLTEAQADADVLLLSLELRLLLRVGYGERDDERDGSTEEDSRTEPDDVRDSDTLKENLADKDEQGEAEGLPLLLIDSSAVALTLRVKELRAEALGVRVPPRHTPVALGRDEELPTTELVLEKVSPSDGVDVDEAALLRVLERLSMIAGKARGAPRSPQPAAPSWAGLMNDETGTAGATHDTAVNNNSNLLKIMLPFS
jgi:hypothetical protein